MEQIRFSYGEIADTILGSWMLPMLRAFEGQHQIEIILEPMDWLEMWGIFKKYALNRSGPIISEVGTTWVSNLVSMKALRPFDPREVIHVGNVDTFVPVAWETASVEGGNQVWAIPWRVDPRVILYWRDMLDEAGVDEETAFSTFEAMNYTLERLTDIGVPMPWAACTLPSPTTVQQIATWIWGAGGDYLSADGRSTRLLEPEAIAGLTAYFELHRYMGDDIDSIGFPESQALFAERRAAVFMGPSWYMNRFRWGEAVDDPDLLGAALPPGPPFIGGSDLVIWDHIAPHNERIAIDLLRMLVSREFQQQFIDVDDVLLLPVRRDVLADPSYTDSPLLSVFGAALDVGYTWPTIPLWGRIEELLMIAFAQIWSDIAEDRFQDIERVVIRHIEPLAARLNRTLGQV